MSWRTWPDPDASAVEAIKPLAVEPKGTGDVISTAEEPVVGFVVAENIDVLSSVDCKSVCLLVLDIEVLGFGIWMVKPSVGGLVTGEKDAIFGVLVTTTAEVELSSVVVPNVQDPIKIGRQYKKS